MKFLWILYTLIGLGAFTISSLLEIWVFIGITGNMIFSVSMVLVLECAKIMTIIMYQFLKSGQEHAVFGVINKMTCLFKTGLFFLSIVCSTAMLSVYLHTPDMEAASKDIQKIYKTFSKSDKDLNENANQILSSLLNTIQEGMGVNISYLV